MNYKPKLAYTIILAGTLVHFFISLLTGFEVYQGRYGAAVSLFLTDIYLMGSIFFGLAILMRRE